MSVLIQILLMLVLYFSLVAWSYHQINLEEISLLKNSVESYKYRMDRLRGRKSPRYIVHPGKVVSMKDGDIHNVSAQRLMQLYRVNPRDCITADQALHGYEYNGREIHLFPRYDGNYKLPFCNGVKNE